jgi:Protein of unknown function DUF262.
MYFLGFENNKDIDSETLYNKGEEPKISKPYDPLKVDILPQTLSIQAVVDRLENKEIDLEPDFQRRKDLWSEKEQSRLIESILIRIPLPAFYFDGRNDDCWTVVDGLQRISTINNFVVRKSEDEFKLKLTDLEYLVEFNGKTFEELPRPMQRRIRECQIYCYCIRGGTPDDVTSSIFKRLNTGGLPLSLAEIRNAVYRGVASNLVRQMAESKYFTNATRNKIHTDRMEDRDFATRFLAFYVLGYEKYTGDMNAFLEEGMSFVKNNLDEQQCNQLLKKFEESMFVCYSLFDKNSFRKMSKNGKFGPLNKSLFESLSASVAKLNHTEQNLLMNNQEIVMEEFKKLFATKFYDSITSATGTIEHVRDRYEILSEFFANLLKRFS